MTERTSSPAQTAVVLGIETSCDETGVGIVRTGPAGSELLANEIASSVDAHTMRREPR